MRIYYSGNGRFPPEKVVDRPNIMLSFAYLNRKNGDHGSRGRLKEALQQNLADSIFIDSGAFSLYLREGQKGCNYDYFSLRRGADFRRYCDRYASFLLRMRGRVLAASVDVIYHPQLTWKVYEYLTKEYGLEGLVPVVHFGTDVKWIDKYIELGSLLIGLGGLAWGRSGIDRWIESMFMQVRQEKTALHGFAVTGWEYLTRWSWYSVDSTTWILTAAYGGIFVPQYRRGSWVYNEPPYVVGISRKSGSAKRPFQTMTPGYKAVVLRWLAQNNATWEAVSGVFNKDGNDPSYGERARLNLAYFEAMQSQRFDSRRGGGSLLGFL